VSEIVVRKARYLYGRRAPCVGSKCGIPSRLYFVNNEVRNLGSGTTGAIGPYCVGHFWPWPGWRVWWEKALTN